LGSWLLSLARRAACVAADLRGGEQTWTHNNHIMPNKGTPDRRQTDARLRLLKSRVSLSKPNLSCSLSHTLYDLEKISYSRGLSRKSVSHAYFP